MDLHTDVTRDKFYPANNDSNANAVASKQTYHNTIELTDGVVGETYITFKVPDDFVSFTSLQLVWACNAGAGNMRWRFAACWAAAGEVSNTHTENTLDDNTANGGIGIINVQLHPAPLVLGTLALGDYVGIQVRRDGAHANDNIDNVVQILGVLFTYVAEQ